MISEIVSMLSRSSAVCHPVLYSILPVIPAFAARARSALIFSIASCISLFDAHDPHQFLHKILQLVLHGKRIFARRAAFERSQRRFRRLVHLRWSSFPAPFSLANLAAYSPARLPNTSKSDSEFPPKPIGPMQTRGAFTRGEQAPPPNSSAYRHPLECRP